MSTQAQKNKYGHLGNEILYPLCLVDGGNSDAEAILKDRGNILTAEGKLQKTRTTQYSDFHGMKHELIEIVENGKMVSRTVDGVPITGNIVQF